MYKESESIIVTMAFEYAFPTQTTTKKKILWIFFQESNFRHVSNHTRCEYLLQMHGHTLLNVRRGE